MAILNATVKKSKLAKIFFFIFLSLLKTRDCIYLKYDYNMTI